MKAKVLKTYVDKDTEKLIEEGTTIEVTDKRFKEINSTEYGILVQEIKNTPAKKKEVETKEEPKAKKKSR